MDLIFPITGYLDDGEEPAYEVSDDFVFRYRYEISNIIRDHQERGDGDIASYYAEIINDTGDLKNMPQVHLEHHLLTVSATVDSNPVNMLSDNGSDNAEAPLKVVNTRGFDLPETGDNGTWIFGAAGVMLIAGALVVMMIAMKKKEKTSCK